MNKEWHAEHRMPEKASTQQRIDWHLEHALVCDCRPIPEGLLGKLSEAEQRKVKTGRAKGKQ
jgi:hypothetical protein